MMAWKKKQGEKEVLEVIENVEDFDHQSGSGLERILFNNRLLVLIACVLVTILLGFTASRIVINANYERMLPVKQPYIANYLKLKEQVSESGNAVRIVVETPEGTIYTAEYMEILRRISDEVFLMPGVFRQFMRSLWTPNTQWMAVTENGIDAGPVIPQEYDGSSEKLAEVRLNVGIANEVGQTVAFDEKSSLIYVPWLTTYPDGSPLDYAKISRTLEDIRAKYEKEGVRIHITGFAKIVGDLIEGVKHIMMFFAVALAIALAILFWYTRCVRSTLVVVACALVGVVWQLGISSALGYELDPYSVLVPFLVFAIAMSHGAQKMNGILQDIGRGTHRVVAARYTFRRLFLAGLTALLSDAVGFAVLMIIDIGVIRQLALMASIGVGVIIFTNLILVPVVLSFTGVSRKAAARSLHAEEAGRSGAEPHPMWRFLDLFTQRRWAATAIICAVLMAFAGHWVSRDLRIGDLDPGAPELRPDSRYNRDNSYLTSHYGASSDVFGIMAKTPDFAGINMETLGRIDALEWKLNQLEGVDFTNSIALFLRRLQVGFSEGNLKWYELIPNESTLGCLSTRAPRGIVNESQSLFNLSAYLTDHKADTLSRVVAASAGFAEENTSPDHEFLLASGNAGIEAATNIVVKKANRQMLYMVYGAVILLCFVTFRSWRAVLCAVLPLMLTSILAEALMVWQGIGVKVATLPVIALGVGIGVDYSLYVLSVVLGHVGAGKSLSVAYYRALLFTGKVVMLIGVTLSVAVVTWVFSPIKFQADMGLLLAFMFLWNMLGALILLPALGHFLLKTKDSAA